MAKQLKNGGNDSSSKKFYFYCDKTVHIAKSCVKYKDDKKEEY